jgi:hypothetical protein
MECILNLRGDGDMSDWVRSEQPEDKFDWKQWWQQTRCKHYWVADRTNPWSVTRWPCTCRKYGSIRTVPAYEIDEIKHIQWIL